MLWMDKRKLQAEDIPSPEGLPGEVIISPDAAFPLVKSCARQAARTLTLAQLYAWKSDKWLAAIEILESDRAGFWEKNGYYMHGDPWNKLRYGWE
jgi:hypothetical protein